MKIIKKLSTKFDPVEVANEVIDKYTDVILERYKLNHIIPKIEVRHRHPSGYTGLTNVGTSEVTIYVDSIKEEMIMREMFEASVLFNLAHELYHVKQIHEGEMSLAKMSDYYLPSRFATKEEIKAYKNQPLEVTPNLMGRLFINKYYPLASKLIVV